MEIKQKPIKHIKQLAVDIADGKVFHSGMVKEHACLPMVFMPVLFLKPEQAELLAEESPALMYEYYDKACPTKVNGMPTFATVQLLSKSDTELLAAEVKKIERLKRKFVEDEQHENSAGGNS